MKKIHMIGGALCLIALISAWIVYDWKLMLILLLLVWGNNLERRQ